MERLANIIEGLRTMLLDCGDNIKASLEFQIDIPGNYMSVSTPSSSMPLEEEDENFELCSLINFLNNELKEEFEEGKIGNILEAVRKYSQRNVSENQSTMPGFSTPSISPGEREVLAYSSRYNFEFEELEKLGEGRHGHVFKCRHKVENAIYAVKKIAFNDEHHNFVLREVRAMARLDHRNIVRYYQDCIEDGVQQSIINKSLFGSSSVRPTKTLYILMEFCPRKLEDLIITPLDEETIERLFRQIVDGLQHIHDKGIIHRDLSKHNIFIDSNDEIKIGDFGSATFVGERGEIANANYTIRSSGTLGNADYRAPEMDNCPALINQKADVFSLGLLFYEALCPMLTSLERKTNFDRFRSATFDWEDFNHFRKQMLNFMLKANPSNRASTEDILLYLDLGEEVDEQVLMKYPEIF